MAKRTPFIKEERYEPDECFGVPSTSPKKKKLDGVVVKSEFACNKTLRVVLERCDYLKDPQKSNSKERSGLLKVYSPPSSLSSATQLLGTVAESSNGEFISTIKREPGEAGKHNMDDMFDIKPVKGIIVIQPETNTAPLPTPGSNKKTTVMTEIVLTPETVADVHLNKSVNRRRDFPLQILYVKLDSFLTGSMLALVGWNSEKDSALMFHCIFCPWAESSAKKIASHLKNEHHLVSFAASKKTHTTTAILYMQCLRCDYVGIDYVAVWIHYALHHGVDGVMSLSSCDQISTTTTMKKLTPTHQATVFPFYSCTECDVLFNDNRHVAKHVTECHYIGDISSSYNGCFVKIKKIIRPKTSNAETYAKLLEDESFADIRSEMFLCLMCSYFSFCRFLAFSHHLRVHTGMAMIYNCTSKNCTHRTSAPDEMISHMKEVHKLSGIGTQRMRADVTLVRQIKDGSLCECVH